MDLRALIVIIGGRPDRGLETPFCRWVLSIIVDRIIPFNTPNSVPICVGVKPKIKVVIIRSFL